MNARAAGAVTNEQVEAAVERFLKLQGHDAKNNANTTEPSSTRTVKDVPEIEPDMENYDDLDDEEPEDEAKKLPAKTTRESRQKKKVASVRKDSDDDDDESVEIDWSFYEDIPLGKQGAKMLTTFGDGKRPKPTAVKAALEGARLMLQTAIRDARHLRRKQKKIYRTAKNSLKANCPHAPGENKQEWSAEILFRAATGYDPLAYDPKCGFGIGDLRQLFPEAMNAFDRWTEMHAATEKSANEEGDEVEEQAANDKIGTATTTSPSKEEVENLTKQYDPKTNIVGHLQERAAQFDLRTDKMHDEWYLKYSAIRQGSFLPRRRRGHSSQADADWEASRKPRGRGEHKRGFWSHMSSTTVRFLHWVGFDPTSRLPPPGEDVTEALGFLSYDFLGQIVEKAILLRNVEKQRKATGEADEAAILVELDHGEQLEESDIVRAMEDPDIKPVPLFSASTEKKLGPQLYFGPGFEDRLELELEEMLGGKNALSEEELKIRQEEDGLFAQLAQPPTEDGIAALVAAKESSGTDKSGEEESVLPQKSAKRPRKV